MRHYAALKGRPIDALLANAGRGLGRGFLDQDWEDIRYVTYTNVTGTAYLIQKIAREMRARNYQTSQRFNRTLSRPLRSHPMAGKIIAVSCDSAHRFSKPNVQKISLIENHGVKGDVHAGRFIKHRYQAKQTPNPPNIRQIHLIQSELFDELQMSGFQVGPGDLGENITTIGIDLIKLPLGSLLHLGRSAVVELTGLRTPCGYIDRFQRGLKRAMIVRTVGGVTFRVGVLGVVRASGDITINDSITVQIPEQIHSLPAI